MGKRPTLASLAVQVEHVHGLMRNITHLTAEMSLWRDRATAAESKVAEQVQFIARLHDETGRRERDARDTAAADARADERGFWATWHDYQRTKYDRVSAEHDRLAEPRLARIAIDHASAHRDSADMMRLDATPRLGQMARTIHPPRIPVDHLQKIRKLVPDERENLAGSLDQLIAWAEAVSRG